MADNNEKFASQQSKMADERKTIDTFADFGNMYNFKKDFTYSYKTDAGLTEDIVREISEKKHEPTVDARFPPQVPGFVQPHGISELGS